MLYEEKGEDITECILSTEGEPEGLYALEKAWQELSTEWHKALMQCLQGDPAPIPIGDSDNVAFFLFKRVWTIVIGE